MAKPQPSAPPDELAPVNDVERALTSQLPPVNSFESVLAEYGITEQTAYVPVPPTIVKSNLPELCVLTTEIKDQRGNTIKDVIGHTGPLMLLEIGEQYDGDKYPGYDGFYTYFILHPKKGKTLITLGRPVGEKQLPVVSFLRRQRKGAWFQVARVKTGGGFGVLVPVPVQ